MLRPLLTSACLLGLAACQSPITAPPPADGTSTPRPAAQIQGRASYLERIAPPPGAVLSVQLVDLQLADTPAAVIVSADFRDLKGPPFAFALPYDPSKLRPNGMYGLHAGVRDAQGRLWFVTDTQVPVTPGTDAPVEFRMVRVTGEPAAATSTPWQCGDQRIGARFDTPARGMMLEIDGNTLHLAQAPSASGARYADAAGNAFWSKGDEATLTLAGRAAVTCRQASQGSLGMQPGHVAACSEAWVPSPAGPWRSGPAQRRACWPSWTMANAGSKWHRRAGPKRVTSAAPPKASPFR